ncbi:MAG TPA: cyclic nucleotide-binding domain-containing protein [Acidimicrobiales bacterium]|nr:cyclic nucleotide-binding domain-containing protein [Acidimicrobiales bacterium]
MRIESSVISISWIPSEAIEGLTTKLPFEIGLAHYDNPPPDVVDDLEALRRADAFRFANELRAWIEVKDGLVVGYGQEGGGHIGATTLRLGSLRTTFAAVAYPDIRPVPEVTGTSVRFVQTSGGRTGVPAPRRVRGKAFALSAPTAWSTLALTIHADGRSEHEVVGASTFPRHWIYGPDGRLAAKTGLIDFETWYREAHGQHSPWGDEETPALVTAVETELERQLSVQIMRQGSKPKVDRLSEGDFLTRQGFEGTDLFLLLDGVLAVVVDGNEIATVGPGALLGERALLEGGLRTSSLRAVTPCKVAVAAGDQIDPAALSEVSRSHRREEQ